MPFKERQKDGYETILQVFAMCVCKMLTLNLLYRILRAKLIFFIFRTNFHSAIKFLGTKGDYSLELPLNLVLLPTYFYVWRYLVLVQSDIYISSNKTLKFILVIVFIKRKMSGDELFFFLNKSRHTFIIGDVAKFLISFLPQMFDVNVSQTTYTV